MTDYEEADLEDNVIECVIQHDIKPDGNSVYFIVPSPSLGLKAKCSARIENDADSPLWGKIEQYSFRTGTNPRFRLAAELEKPFNAYTPTAVVSLVVIEER